MNMKPAMELGVRAAIVRFSVVAGKEWWHVALSSDGEDADSGVWAEGPSMEVAFSRALERFRK